MYQINYEIPVHIHFIGIGGISMSGLAAVLLKRGFPVSGSDCERISAHRLADRHGRHDSLSAEPQPISHR